MGVDVEVNTNTLLLVAALALTVYGGLNGWFNIDLTLPFEMGGGGYYALPTNPPYYVYPTATPAPAFYTCSNFFVPSCASGSCPVGQACVALGYNCGCAASTAPSPTPIPTVTPDPYLCSNIHFPNSCMVGYCPAFQECVAVGMDCGCFSVSTPTPTPTPSGGDYWGYSSCEAAANAFGKEFWVHGANLHSIDACEAYAQSYCQQFGWWVTMLDFSEPDCCVWNCNGSFE